MRVRERLRDWQAGLRQEQLRSDAAVGAAPFPLVCQLGGSAARSSASPARLAGRDNGPARRLHEHEPRSGKLPILFLPEFPPRLLSPEAAGSHRIHCAGANLPPVISQGFRPILHGRRAPCDPDDWARLQQRGLLMVNWNSKLHADARPLIRHRPQLAPVILDNGATN